MLKSTSFQSLPILPHWESASDCLVLNSLRKNADTLQQLREKLFTLWGNLEEVKLGPNQGVDESTSAHSCKPFNCWIKEYGVHTTDRDCSKLGPCEPEHWERKFRMFQTTIL
jgi:protection-of-telomeres protein 1